MKLPAKIRGYRSRVINALIDICRGNNLLAGKNIRLSSTPTGTMISAVVERFEIRKPFEVLSGGKESVYVTEGTWIRNKIALTIDTDANRDYLTVTGLDADGTWYVYLKLGVDDLWLDPRITPQKVDVVASQTSPHAGEDIGRYKLLATVVVTDGVAGKPEQVLEDNFADEFFGEDGFDYKRFRVDYVDKETVLVNAGTWKRETLTPFKFDKVDTDVAGEGNDNAGFSTPFETNKTYYVYLQLKPDEENYLDVDLSPLECWICCSQNLPAEPNPFRQTVRLLGSFSTMSDSADIDQSTLTRHWIGDIDDTIVRPDYDADRPAASQIDTLQFRPDTQGELEMFGAHADKLTLPDVAWSGKKGIPYLSRVDGTGALAWGGIDSEGGAEWPSQSIELSTYGLALKGFYFNQHGGILDATTELNGLDKSILIRSRPAGEHYAQLEYVAMNEMKVADSYHADEADTALSADVALEVTWDNVTGKPSFVTDHGALDGLGDDDHAHYWANTAYRDPDVADYATSGDVSAGEFNLQGDEANNLWNTTNFYVDATGLVAMKSGADGFKIQSNSATGDPAHGGVLIEAENQIVLYIPMYGFLAFGDEGLNLVGSPYAHDSNTGLDIADWFSGGIFYGANVVVIDSSDLKTTDKILVWRAT